MTYVEKLERVYREYESSLDLDIALTIIPLTQDERERIIDDPDFQARIAVCDAIVRSTMITQLRDLCLSENESVKLSALKQLGKSYYPKRFDDTKRFEIEANIQSQVIVYIPENGRDPKERGGKRSDCNHKKVD